REQDKAPLTDRTVSCFTGGVDSFDTLIRNESNIDALMYIHGFDIPLARTDVREVTSEHLQDIASMTGKELIEGSTNIRRFLNRAGKWPTVTHGAALSSIGHLLSGQFGRQLIPASHTYSDTFAWGSHPLLDHLWSSNRLSTVHDGAGSTRVDKTKRVAAYPAAREHLRVCWQNTGKYNCGVCDKCVRTMVALSLSGALPEFKTFDSEITTDTIRYLQISGVNSLAFVQENLDFAREQGATEIEAALNDLVTAYEARKEAKSTSASVAALERRLTRLETNMKATRTRAVAAEKS